ncbi:MAG: DUF1800 family protein [Verrucomicrobiaceae bacterium]|nr:DUF1800 family protein [Verrucomicrobiaceae bacterium]
MTLCATSSVFGITDLLKWPAGQVPVGQTNGPDQLDDIWQGLFNAWALAPSADEDNDGCSNLVESIAGTNPFSTTDCLKVGNTVITGGNVIFTVKAEAGKKYRVLSYDTPNGASTVVSMTSPVAATQWIPTTNQATANIVITKPANTRKFYRLETSDVDTDGDGVTDWAERRIGLNPNATDSDLDGVPDGTLVSSELQIPDTVTISATKSIAAEDPLDPGEVTITRTRKLLPMTVNYSVTGTASTPTDFTAAPSGTSVALLAGETSKVIAITPVQDSAAEAGESVTVTLTSATTGSLPNPTIGSPSNATVIINNSTAATGTGLKARYYDTSSSTQADAANFGQLSNGGFVYTRNGSTPYTGSTIVVPTTYSGPPALAVGNQVKLSFNGGGLDGSAFDNQVYAITAVNPGVSFTVGISGAGLSTVSSYTNQTCSFSIQSFPHPGVVERIEAVNFDWQHGTPNGAVILPNNSADNYSDTFETFLNPTTAGSYVFQLDADDKARVLVDLDLSGTFDLPQELVVEHNWNVPGSDPVGTFKQGFSLAGAATTANSPVISVPSTTGLAVGMAVSGTGLPTGEFITAIGSGQITVTTGTNVTAQASTTLIFTPVITLAVPGTPAQRYKMRVEHVETTGDARCRLQWSVNGGTFANIPQANQFTHTQALNYSFSGANAVIIPTGGHSLTAGGSVSLAFSTGVLSTPGTSLGTHTGNYTISSVSGSGVVTVAGASTTAGSATVTVPSTAGLVVGMAITGTGLPANEFITAVGSGNITVTTGTGVTAQASTTLTATSTFVVPITAFSVPVSGAATTAGSAIVSVPSTAGLATGMAISGTGLPANEFITAITQSTPTQPGLLTVTTSTGITTQASTTVTAVLPAGPVTGAGFVQNMTTSTTTGVFNLSYPNTTFTGSPGRMAVDAAVTTGNNGLWNSGTPDGALIAADTFSARWTGQVQPQFSEEYTFVVQADDGCALWINGQPQVLKMYPSASTGGSTYTYNATTGDLTLNYSGLATVAGSFVVGETVRLDPTSGNLNHNPTTVPTYTYDPTTNLMVVDYTNLVPPASGGTRTAGSYVVGETVELDPTSGSLNSLSLLPYTITAVSGNTFTVNAGSLTFNPTLSIVSIATGAACQITTATNHNLTTGAQVRISSVSGGTFSPAINDLWTVTVTAPNSFTVASNCTVAPTSGTGTVAASGNITVSDNRNLVITSTPTTTSFVVNIGTGKYADASTGNMNVDIVNKSLKDWASNTNERYARIPMTGGLRYDIQLDYYESSSAARCLLSWFSASQPKQIIPAERLYPSTGAIQPPASTTPTDAVALVGGAFSLPVTGDNGSTPTVSGLPAWLNYSGGVLSGTPPAGTAGTYQIIVTTTGSAGTGTSVINLVVQENAGNVTREIWSGVSGTTVAGIPTSTAPSLTGTLSTLESPSNYDDNYGERLRGYITAPVTGNYYFWIAASNAAELWIANDDDSVNTFRRAYVTTGTNSQEWNAAGETNQKSGWLALEAGKRYYVEVLHKAGVGSDNLAIGWSKPGQSTAAPSEVVPSYVLSPYVAPAPGATQGTLYISTMLAQAGAVTNGVGTATLRVSGDESVAYLRFSYSGLTGSLTSKHIHADPYLSHPAGEIIYDIDTPDTPGDGLITNPSDPNYGAYKWTIAARGTYSAAEIREIIKEGKTYINLHTGMYPNGEIRGNFTLSNGTRTFTAPPAPPAWTDDSNTDAGAVRFLTQASFGANIAEIAALKGLAPSGTTNSRYETWINNQFALSATPHLSEVLAREIADVFGSFDVKVAYDTWWKTSMTAPDQLRQKVAFALSQIHVVSGSGPLEDNSRAIADFYDTLATNAFGNFSDVLTGTTLTPGMGRYLDMLRNDKPDIAVGRSPNENYAREIKQLFSIGLYRMWPDGTLMLSKDEAPIDTYTQREIVGLAHVFTGWEYGYDGAYRTSFSASADWTRPMREVPARHFTGTKRVLNNEVFPGLTSVGGQPLDPYATHLSTQYNDATYQALPAQELAAAHAMLFNHPNTGPFICRQLIQRMVTSNPSRDYLYRVVQKFNDNGSGLRGDMKAVIKAILLDYEARSPGMITIPAFGKQREPVQRVTNAARALRPAGVTGSYAQSGTNVITITTTTPHLLTAGNSVFLEFTDTTGDPAKPAPTTGTYSVVSVTDGTHYTINAPGWMGGTYSQTAGNNFITVTMSGHWLPGTNGSQPSLPSANFGQAYFDFITNATGTLPADGIRTTTSSTSFDTPSGVGNVSGSTFTIPAPDTTARSGNVAISRFPSSYSCTGRNGVITIDTTYSSAGAFGTMADHHLSVGDQVFLNFMNSRDTTSFNETSTENDLVYTITDIPDPNTFTVQARDAANAAMASDNQVTVFPLKAQPLTRSGNINARPSTFTMDNTDTDLAQTPLNSPTVFNYFLPDYKFAGSLASQGITTPEFQLTSETTVIRQANFFHAGVFNPNSTTGYSSFKNGTNAMVMDLSPWMGTTFPLASDGLGLPSDTNKAWTSNANLSTLIDHFNTLLLAGQLPAAAKTTIVNYLNTPISAITVSNPCSITTASAHGLVDGDSITISGVTGGTFRNSANSANVSINQAFTVTVTSATTFTLNITGGIRCTSTAGLILTSAYYSPIAYTDSGPTATQIRDRLRNVLHLILTSPDYAIQR